MSIFHYYVEIEPTEEHERESKTYNKYDFMVHILKFSI